MLEFQDGILTLPYRPRQDPMTETRLSFTDHNRPFFGLETVYPVVSRRAGGVSVGINLNRNNACNWACAYCQVPDLVRGKAAPTDLNQLERELNFLLDAVTQETFLETYVPVELRHLKDIAFSGNGEPTSSDQFSGAMDIALRALEQRPPLRSVKIITITNGSHVQEPAVLHALEGSTKHGGELWFKIDRGSPEDIWQVNQIHLSLQQIQHRLATIAPHCPTWIQTCMTTRDGVAPSTKEVQRYLDFIRHIKDAQIPIKGILLYTLARPSLQPGGTRLGAIPGTWMAALAEKIEALGVPVVTV
ncbi:MAG: radical SAM protein [Ferrovum sp.]|jgi:wyosine [tRNA(Phe)-imidazoG37] synthetase (radical SAM superfamily)|nr:radical SAM protein [Ferrovum sp.]